MCRNINMQMERVKRTLNVVMRCAYTTMKKVYVDCTQSQQHDNRFTLVNHRKRVNEGRKNNK